MPVNRKKCLPFKDTWAAPNSELYAALELKDNQKAAMIYERCEKERQESIDKGKKNATHER
jgi:hypothetical protein